MAGEGGKSFFHKFSIGYFKDQGAASLQDPVEFLKDYPEARALMLYREGDRLKMKGILCVPCEIFLKALHPKPPW